jgi:hypothetical protein
VPDVSSLHGPLHESGLDGLLDKRAGAGFSPRGCAWHARQGLLLHKVQQQIVLRQFALIEGFVAQHLLADRGYDSNDIIARLSGKEWSLLSHP